MKRIHIIAIAAVVTVNLTLCMPPVQSKVGPEASEDLSGDSPPQPSDVPVSGGLSLLLSAGAALGSSRLLSVERIMLTTIARDQYP